MTTDRELLVMAAKAAGIKIVRNADGALRNGTGFSELANIFSLPFWNPLLDDGDALRLAVTLRISADFFDDAIYVGYTPLDNECDQVQEPTGSDPYAATRRAIVRAAAEIGKGMK